MKLQNTFLTLLILFISFQVFFGQKKPNMELFDNFEAVNCSEIRSRSDSFLMSLANEPETVGYVIFFSGSKSAQFSFYEKAIKSHIKHRSFFENRVKFITTNLTSNFKVEFWLTRNGAKPQITETEYNLDLTPTNGRYLFTSDLVEVSKTTGKLTFFSECEVFIETINYELLEKYLKANSEIDAEIFVYNKKRSSGDKVIKLFLNEATRLYKIPLNRLRIGYAGIDEEVAEINGKVSTIKIWLVSQKKK